MGTYRQPSANIDKTHTVVNAELDKARKEMGDRMAVIAKNKKAAKLAALKNLQKNEKKKVQNQNIYEDDLNKISADFDQVNNQSNKGTDKAIVESQEGVSNKVFEEGVKDEDAVLKGVKKADKAQGKTSTDAEQEARAKEIVSKKSKVNPFAIRAAIVEQQTGLKGKDQKQENIDKSEVKDKVRNKVFKTNTDKTDLPKINQTNQSQYNKNIVRSGSLSTPIGHSTSGVDLKAISTANEVYSLTDQATDLVNACLKDMRDIGITQGPNSASYKEAKRTAENIVKNFNVMNAFLNKTIGTNYKQSYNQGKRKLPNKTNAFLYDIDEDLENTWDVRASLTDNVNLPNNNDNRWSLHANGENYILTYQDETITDSDQINTLSFTVEELDDYIQGKGRGKGFLQTLDGDATNDAMDFIYKGGGANMNAGAQYKTLVETIKKYKEGEEVGGNTVTKTDVIKSYVAANEYMKEQINEFVDGNTFAQLGDIKVQSVYQMIPGFEDIDGGKVYKNTEDQKTAVKEYLLDYFKTKYPEGNADQMIKSSNVKITKTEIEEEKKSRKANVSAVRAEDIINGDGIALTGGIAFKNKVRNILGLADTATGFNLKDIAKNTTALTSSSDGLTNLATILNTIDAGAESNKGDVYVGKFASGADVLKLNPNAKTPNGDAVVAGGLYLYEKDGQDNINVVPRPGVSEGTKKDRFNEIQRLILLKSKVNADGVKNIISGDTSIGEEIVLDIDSKLDLKNPETARQYFYNRRNQTA